MLTLLILSLLEFTPNGIISQTISSLELCFPVTVQFFIKKWSIGASLVAQWLRTCLPMQRTQAQALVWEDPTCRGATRPMSHNYWACASGACAPQQERPRQWEARAPRWRAPRSPQLEKALTQKRRPNAAKNKNIKIKSIRYKKKKWSIN